MSLVVLRSILRHWPVGRQCLPTYDERLDNQNMVYRISKVTWPKGDFNSCCLQSLELIRKRCVIKLICYLKFFLENGQSIPSSTHHQGVGPYSLFYLFIYVLPFLNMETRAHAHNASVDIRTAPQHPCADGLNLDGSMQRLTGVRSVTDF